MRLPFADAAVVADAKLVDYLLNADHPRGRTKARFFVGAGFRREAPEELRAALVAIAASADMAAIEHPAGTKFIGDGVVRTPNGRMIALRTVWLLDGDRPPPRFVTAYPARGIIGRR